jgi:benzoyl-CoA reductase/2-hydroxyglutaryl-CoA dehydratase subunit BcrC/BadD/HgdB
VIYAAGKRPVDLNNLLVMATDPARYLDLAEHDGMPRTTCAWTKGIYAIARAERIRRVVGVLEGDCSNTRAIVERWRMDGIEVIPFAYPHDRSRRRMREELACFAGLLGVTMDRAEKIKKRLDQIRAKVHRLDELTWREGLVTGEENHIWQVTCSDFQGTPERFERELGLFLAKAGKRRKKKPGIRIGYVGVPPIVKGLYGELRRMGFDVVYNEVQRQFAMPYETRDLASQYLAYTYPYEIQARLADIKSEVKKRCLSGIIHYVQSFCHRAIEDYLVQRAIGVPVLTLECDRPGGLDERNRIRLEAFGEMLRASRSQTL